MKTFICIVLSIISFGVVGQEINPTYEKNGNAVDATYFHPNGEIAQKGSFKEGKLSGLWMMYNQQGEKIAQGYYVDGKKTGKWFIWEDGQLNEVDYIDNQIVNHIRWDKKKSIVQR